eukprot:364355-Chlamydomonas_euryale.AAC.15
MLLRGWFVLTGWPVGTQRLAHDSVASHRIKGGECTMGPAYKPQLPKGNRPCVQLNQLAVAPKYQPTMDLALHVMILHRHKTTRAITKSTAAAVQQLSSFMACNLGSTALLCAHKSLLMLILGGHPCAPCSRLCSEITDAPLPSGHPSLRLIHS